MCVPARLLQQNRVRRRRRHHRFGDRIGKLGARLRAVVVADLHHRPRLGQDRHQAVEQRLGGHRLDADTR